MADDRRRSTTGGADTTDEGSPAAAYQMFEVMSDLNDKLKLLNFEEHFIKANNIRPFSRHYFALSTNPGEQFSIFSALSAWLINVSGKHFKIPQEYDDPNATVSNILDEVRNFGINTDFAPSKLKTGSGEFVCYILDRLADVALKNTNFAWMRPTYPVEDPGGEEGEDDDHDQDEDKAELKLDQIEAVAAESGDEDEAMIDLAVAAKLSGEALIQTEIMQSTTTSEEWKLEVERVTPSLKVTVRTDNKDWRTHVEQMQLHKKSIQTSLDDATGQLDKLKEDISKTLEKIGSREKYINNQLEQYVQEYRSAQDRLAQAKQKYKEGSSGVTERSRMLADLTDELDKIKMEMEEKGSSMTDGAPLVKIKQTLNRLKLETTQMDIRIGVSQHVLRQAQLRDKQSLRKGMDEVADHLGMQGMDTANMFSHM